VRRAEASGQQVGKGDFVRWGPAPDQQGVWRIVIIKEQQMPFPDEIGSGYYRHVTADLEWIVGWRPGVGVRPGKPCVMFSRKLMDCHKLSPLEVIAWSAA